MQFYKTKNSCKNFKITPVTPLCVRVMQYNQTNSLPFLVVWTASYLGRAHSMGFASGLDFHQVLLSKVLYED